MTWLVSLLVTGALVLLSACDWPWSSPSKPGSSAGPNPTSTPGPRRIRFLSDNSAAIGLELDGEAAAKFSPQTGTKVDVINGPATTSDRLAESELYLMAEAPDIDVF